MRNLLLALSVASLLALLPAATAHAAVAVAVFDFELIDTSLEGATNGARDDEHARLVKISERLRQRLAEHKQWRSVDIAPVAAQARSVHLRACGGCDADLARKVGAELSITGTVQKVSNLILNMKIAVRRVATGRLIATMNADMRGNTEESWTRALDWLFRNRLRPALGEARE